ncbi:MAG: hypothetical protein JWL77_73 [Chthonomonadaceae bacterium]|nr:hypothetical protein [Chthonomonadaceae bacterium]
MSQTGEKDPHYASDLSQDSRRRRTIVFESSAAYNCDALQMPKPNGPNGRRVLNLEMLMNHPFYWEWLNEKETEEVLMELYIARTRRAQ